MECEGGVAPVFPSLLELTKAEKCLMDASTGDDMDGQAIPRGRWRTPQGKDKS